MGRAHLDQYELSLISLKGRADSRGLRGMKAFGKNQQPVKRRFYGN